MKRIKDVWNDSVSFQTEKEMRRRQTIFYLMTAVGAVETVGTETHVTVVGRVDTGGSVKARVVGASLLGRRLAPASVESRRAVTSRVGLTLISHQQINANNNNNNKNVKIIVQQIANLNCYSFQVR